VACSPRPASRDTSRTLTRKELKDLYSARGHMPQISFRAPQEQSRVEIEQRVAGLDRDLQETVQGLCDRLLKTQNKADNAAVRCCKGCWRVTRNHVKLGVIREILPHVLFYLCYSNAVTYYAWHKDWDVRWTAAKQDAIYYPAVVLAFLVCFRASGCMDRYKEGMRTIFEMEKTLRELAFEVLTHLRLETDMDWDGEQSEAIRTARYTRLRYFKHEFRRMSRLLFACAARDLNDSALEGNQLSEEDADRIQCALTEVEHAAILVTHSAFGHAFRVYLAAAWLLKLVRGIKDENLFDDDGVMGVCEDKIAIFKGAWLDARQVAYSSMPSSVIHILWLLTTVMNLFMPWEWVSICQWSTWFPSMLLTISFYGILQIANAMENPFGFDDDDIQVWEVSQHLDEEICLIMHYAVLDEVGGENLYRSMMGQEMIFVSGGLGTQSGEMGSSFIPNRLATL